MFLYQREIKSSGVLFSLSRPMRILRKFMKLIRFFLLPIVSSSGVLFCFLWWSLAQNLSIFSQIFFFFIVYDLLPKFTWMILSFFVFCSINIRFAVNRYGLCCYFCIYDYFLLLFVFFYLFIYSYNNFSNLGEL